MHLEQKPSNNRLAARSQTSALKGKKPDHNLHTGTYMRTYTKVQNKTKQNTRIGDLISRCWFVRVIWMFRPQIKREISWKNSCVESVLLCGVCVMCACMWSTNKARATHVMLARANTTSLACAQSPKPLSDAQIDSKLWSVFAPGVLARRGVNNMILFFFGGSRVRRCLIIVRVKDGGGETKVS